MQDNNGKAEVNVRIERIRGVCQMLADYYDSEMDSERAMVFRRAIAHEQPLNHMPVWAYRRTVAMLKELQRDVETT